MKRAFITGVSGQDGSYLAELLLSKGYDVHGLVRRVSVDNKERIAGLPLTLHEGDMLDRLSLKRAIMAAQPHEVYNLAAQSHVGTSFKCPSYTQDVIEGGTRTLLELVLEHTPTARFYQASTSEMFGKSVAPQSENTPFSPASPYARAKVKAHELTVEARVRHGLHASCGILFNHESPRRGEEFVTRKITLGVAAIARGKLDKLHLGNISARRDWGYAPEYVEAMWLMLQQPHGDDYVIATGRYYTVADWLEMAFKEAGLDWLKYVTIDDSQMRPVDVPLLCGNPVKALDKLGWQPHTFAPELVRIMLAHDMEKAK